MFCLLSSGCGFEPVYKMVDTPEFNDALRYIQIAPIENRVGQQLRNHLVQDIAPLGNQKPIKYVLSVSLTETKSNLAIKKSEIATRANLIFRANYKLFSKSTGKELTSGQSHMITSYNILTQTFATLIAEKDARKRAVREISSDISGKVVGFFNMLKNKSDKVS